MRKIVELGNLDKILKLFNYYTRGKIDLINSQMFM